MQNVPKIVRERLQAGTPVAGHPDANLLTAFAERSLPDRERAAVLEHLARCGDCRDVLALASPTSEAVQTVITPARRGWLTWPVLRWGLVAAGGIVVVSLGILQYQRHLAPATMVARQTQPEAVATNLQTQPATPSPAAVPAEKQEQAAAGAGSAGKTGPEFAEHKLIARAEAPLASVQEPKVVGGAASGAVHGQLLHGPQMPTQWQQQSARAQVSVPAAPSATAKQQAADMAARIPSAAETVEVQAAGGAAPVGTETRNKESQLQAEAGQPQPELDFSARAVGKAKPAVNPEAAAAAPMSTLARSASQGTTGANAAPMLRWTISPAGGLQRSFDQGNTWQDVNVNAGPVPTASFTSVEVVAKAAPTPAKDNYADKKALKAAPAALIFRAVAAIGPQVWAGGSNGALYHSPDAGGHWTQVVPTADGALLSGDIVGLEFSDPQHGKVTTSTAEVWITTDAGQTWQKQ
jgi:hypothetical protein